MQTGNSPHRQVWLLSIITLLAASAWGYNFWQEKKQAPIRQHIEAGRILIQRGDGQSAEFEWRSAVKLDPANVEAWELLGDYYAEIGQWPLSQDAFQHLTQLQPQTPRAWSRLANAAAHEEKIDIVKMAVVQALQHDPNDADALNLNATLLARSKKWDEQIAVLQKLVKLQPDNVAHSSRLADTYIVRHRYTEALGLLNKILATNSQFAAGYSMRAEALMEDNPNDKSMRQAEADLRKAISLEPDYERARWLLGKLYLKIKQPVRAAPHFARLAKTYPDRPVFLNDLASAYQAAGQTSQAIATRQKAATLVALVERRQLLQSRLANNPNDFDSNLEMGLSLLRGDNSLNADKYLSKALALRPKDSRALAAGNELEKLYTGHVSAGLAALKTGDIKKADHEIGRAMLLRPRDPRTSQAVNAVTMAAQKMQISPVQ